MAMTTGYVDRIADRAADALDAFNRSMDPEGSAPTDVGLQAEVDELLRPALERDFDRAKARFDEGDEFVSVDRGLPEEVIERIRCEIVFEHATRSAVPWHRAAGSIGYRRIQREAPFTAAVYRSAVLREYVSKLTGKPILCKSDDDDHACTFYIYTKAGDRMAYHYDICGCEDGGSYSLIIGVVNDSSQKLLVKLHAKNPAKNPARKTESFGVPTPPGMLITFSGAKVFHGVSRLGKGERRVTLGLAYQTTGYQPPTRRFVKVFADTFFHFGVGGLVKRVTRR